MKGLGPVGGFRLFHVRTTSCVMLIPVKHQVTYLYLCILPAALFPPYFTVGSSFVFFLDNITCWCQCPLDKALCSVCILKQ